jgi:Prokaryotic lipoprotein-attachment site
MRCRLAVIVVTCISLAGCGVKGDFGRVSSSLVHDDIHSWMGPATTPIKNASTWRHQLTDEERKLRDLAYPLIEPPYDRNKWLSVLGEAGVGSGAGARPNRGEYASRLITTAYRSQTARYNKLIEDIRNDVARLDPFFAAARSVTDMDIKREKAMAHVSSLSAEERNNTKQRMAENRNIVVWVQAELQERTASYKLALERLVIAAPLPAAAEAERALTLLEQSISRYST